MTQVFLPSMRQLVSLRLRSHGLSQNKISALLGVTQASVSLYLRADSAKAYDSLSTLLVSRADADRFCVELSGALTKSPVEGVKALNGIWVGILGSGSACPAHRGMYPNLSECDMCIREYGPRRGEKSQAIAEVAEAVRLLEASRTFVALMPEVSVNLACATEDAKTQADIVAVPGRIVKVKDRAKAMLPPEAGASVHMSKVLLQARSLHPELRACINLRYDERVDKAMRTARLRILTIGRRSHRGKDDSTVEALERKLTYSLGPFDAIVDEGGGGIEPNVYLFAKGAREVAVLALRLSRAYSAA